MDKNYYMALKYHMEDALKENNITYIAPSSCPSIALFSRKYYNEINNLDNNKTYDFCFIGSINSSINNRLWVIDFAKKYFTENSLFVNTDNDPNWKLLGSYDKSLLNLGFCPKNNSDNQSKNVQYRIIEENKFYFSSMRKSKFVLCPAGDSPWSFRFYETLMCGSIPIVECYKHTFRTELESRIKYYYMLKDKVLYNIPYEYYVNENTKTFKRYHMILCDSNI